MSLEATIVNLGKRIHDRLFGVARKKINASSFPVGTILSINEGCDLIYKLLLDGKPFVVSRFGQVELSVLVDYLEIGELKKLNRLHRIYAQIIGKVADWSPKSIVNIERNAGFFPVNNEHLIQFSELYIDSLKRIDALGVWYNYGEQIMHQKYLTHAQLIPLESIEPYYSAQPWSKQLAGKKVLVIHPFEKTIQHQYAKQSLLFTNPDILPAFELKTIKAVQSAAFNDSGFSSWFEALESMKKQMQQTDFDIALIGAGAYGLPLAAYAKDLGKQAIHFGGSLQILFGIKGARWDDNPQINQFYNEHWVRPFQEDTPDGYKKVEDGCYW